MSELQRVLARSKSLFALPSYQADKLSSYYAAVRWNTDLNPDLELLQLLAELGKGSFVLPDLYTALPEFQDSTLL